MEHLHDLDLEDQPVRQRKPVFEPRTVYDFCKIFSSVTGLPIGKFLKDTKDWPITWFLEVQSLCKEKDKAKQASTINWYVKKYKESLKEVEPKTLT